MKAMAAALGLAVALCVPNFASAANYCAHYIGGPERATPGAHRSQCHFATLSECRASVRRRGGGKCYRSHYTPPQH